ncbi:Hypothetical predicted protein [Cloeon dipterum]|uniref:Uncharacterized protein n=1 Tax=Cloeon dipterum TaxID=197152 RepID=A0A8S1D424_9INSE|nr:Hypothetical predicted protein [Cloeon dipterum]
MGTLSKAFKFASKTRKKVGRAFSFNRTPSKLKRAVSSVMSPFGSSLGNTTPCSQLEHMRLASCTSLASVTSLAQVVLQRSFARTCPATAAASGREEGKEEWAGSEMRRQQTKWRPRRRARASAGASAPAGDCLRRAPGGEWCGGR